MSALTVFSIYDVKHSVLCCLNYDDIQNFCIVIGYKIPDTLRQKYIDPYIRYGVTLLDPCCYVSQGITGRYIANYASLQYIINNIIDEADNLIPSIYETMSYKNDNKRVEFNMFVQGEGPAIDAQATIYQYVNIAENILVNTLDISHTFNTNDNWKQQVVNETLAILLFYCMPRYIDLKNYCMISKWECEREEFIQYDITF